MAVPSGVIAMWSGTLASIPSNWLLCDGTNDTPNLVAKFIKGAAAGSEAGGTGGSDTHNHTTSSAGDHTHALGSGGSHTHTVNSSGDHTAHRATLTTQASGTFSIFGLTTGAHQHTTTTGTSAHTHTSGVSGTHTHTVNSSDGRPPYYEIAYIMSNGSAEVTTGIIIIWTGLLADIPAGWTLCNGTSSPDLRSKFIRGINTSVTNPGTTGGNSTHNHTESSESHTHTDSDSQGAHTHDFSAYTWTHNHNITVAEGENVTRFWQNDSSAGDHTHTTSDSTGAHTHTLASAGSHTHTINTSSSLPTYYDVAYIISSSATSVPAGGILIWTGLIASIPDNLVHCNGTDTPDLRGKYLRGSDSGTNPGGTGGSNTHTHTDENNADHTDHTVSSSGSHQHSATNTTGNHTHSYLYDSLDFGGHAGTTSCRYGSSVTTGNHSHTYNSEGAHTNHTVGSQSTAHTHDWSTDSGEPAYYEVQFIMFSGGLTTTDLKYWDGAAWTTATSIKYWDGAAWAELTAVYYWNTTQWQVFWG